MKQRLLRLLNIKPSESGYVFDLLSIQLSIGIANSFVNIVSFTFFIHHFPVSTIAYAYLVVAGALLLLNLGYERLEQKMAPLKLFSAIVAVSTLILLLFRGGLMAPNQNPVIFMLLVWSTLFYMVTSYAYWGMAAQLFNIRESKRIFSIVGSGDVPAKLIGYIVAPLLIPLMGIDNLLLLSVVALGVGYLLLRKLQRKQRWSRMQQKHHHRPHPVHQSAADTSLRSFFLKNRLIFFISLLSLLSYNVFNLIDYTFVTQIKAKVSNLSQLATYVAIFFAAGRTITLILKLVFTSRMIERLGIITCLMITPVTLFVCSVLFVLFDQPHYTLYEFAVMAMLSEVLRSAMQEPVFFILFQPLNEHNRLRGHLIAKGYMLAPSLLIVGTSLLVAEALDLTLTIPIIIKVLLLNLIAWTLIIKGLKKAYAKALHQSITRGLYSGDLVAINDPATINVLVNKATSGSASERIYALKLLEGARYPEIQQLLLQQLSAGDNQLTRYALQHLEATGGLNAPLLHKIGTEHPDAATQELVAAALCSLDSDQLRQYAAKLPTLSRTLRKQVIELLLRHKEFPLFRQGCNEVQQLLVSANPHDREQALEIFSERSDLLFTDPLQTLIADPDPSVRRSAVLVACKLQTSSLLPLLLQRLQTSSDKFLVMQGLFQYGDSLFADLAGVPSETVDGCTNELVKIAAKVKGQAAVGFLLQLLQTHEDRKDKVIHALWQKGFQAELVADIFTFERLLHRFVQQGIKKIGLHAAVPECRDKAVLRKALESELWNDLTTALKICAILYPRKEINRVIELAENQDRQKLYNAMEMLELLVPKRTAREINDLFEYVLDPSIKKKHITLLDANGFFREIVLHHPTGFNAWTRALCLYSSWRLGQQAFLREVAAIPEQADHPMVAETRGHVLNHLSESRYVTH